MKAIGPIYALFHPLLIMILQRANRSDIRCVPVDQVNKKYGRHRDPLLNRDTVDGLPVTGMHMVLRDPR